MAIKFCNIIIGLSVLLLNYSNTAIAASLSSACPGGQVMLSCSAAAGTTLLKWSIRVPSRSTPEERFISSSSSASSLAPLIVGQTMFQFLRNSTSPLTSLMVIDNVSSVVNGTRVECSYGGIVVSTDIINVIGDDATTLNSSGVLHLVSEQFGTESVTVTLGWQNMLHNVHVHVVPEPLTKNIGNSTVQLVVPYNVPPHLVKSVATLCEQNTTDVITLHYVRCVHPLHLLVDEHLSINAKSTNDAQPLIPFKINASLNISCRSSKVLIGPNSSTCTEDGNWEPDPREVECKVDCREPVFNDSRITVKYTTTLEDSILTYDCREGFLPRASIIAICYHNGSWVPNPTYHTCTIISNGPAGETKLELNLISIIILGSSTAILILSIVISCIVGCACGYCCQSHKKTSSSHGTSINKTVYSPQHSSPLYESITPPLSSDEKQDIELKSNVVYGQNIKQVAAV